MLAHVQKRFDVLVAQELECQGQREGISDDDEYIGCAA